MRGTTLQAHRSGQASSRQPTSGPQGPGSTADPYAHISLSSLAGHRHKMKVVHGTLCPVFSETYCFPISGGRWWGSSHPCLQVLRTELQVPVLGDGHWAQPQPLGELCLLLGSVDLQHVLECWQQLGPLGATKVRLQTTRIQPIPAQCVHGETEALSLPTA
ncbi:hypothetical protein MC885_009884 [Smutsia gigantea]|nr:hypothetical protein MC885_009884 [Smutsia gigantea]